MNSTIPHQAQLAIDRIALSVQPLVFETGDVNFPYTTKGTVFLVGYRGRAYVLTARHALNPENPLPICVFPTDESHRIIPLKDVYYIPRSEIDSDFADIAVTSIDIDGIVDDEVGKATLIDTALACVDWQSYAEYSQFFILGYPEQRSYVDYDIQEIRTERILMFGHYGGPSSVDYLHKFHVSPQEALETFSGFSGAPVYAWIEKPGSSPVPTLCGMALRGTPGSGVVHFVDQQIILDMLEIKYQLDCDCGS